MGLLTRPWWSKHRTVIFAIVLTAAIAAAVHAGRYEAMRAVFPLTVVWALAFHSIDNRGIVERMEAAASNLRRTASGGE